MSETPQELHGSLRPKGWFLKKPGKDMRTEVVTDQKRSRRLRALAADAAGELDVLGHDRHALGVDRAEVCVLEEAHEVGLGGLLEREDGRALEAQVR